MAAAKPATVRVLHRAVDSGDEGSSCNSQSGSPQQSIQELKAANDSLKQRLDQAKSTSASERRKLADELRLERAGRERAEEVLVRQAKELEACAAAKARLEEAFSRVMSELRYTRAEHAQSKNTIQQLLRELMLLRDAISRSSQGNASSSGRSSSNPAGANGGGGSGGGGGGGGSPMAGGKQQMSKGQMYSEIQAMRLRITEEEKRRKEAEAEKERAEESQEMISKQTAKLLDDRAALLSNLSSKDDVVREMQAALDAMHHQLDIALQDRALLFEQLRTIAGVSSAPDLSALTAAMSGSGYDQQDLDELEAFAHGAYNGELHGALAEVCSPRSERQQGAALSEGLAGLQVGGEGQPAAAAAYAAGGGAPGQ